MCAGFSLKKTSTISLSIDVRITMIRCVVYSLQIFKMFHGLLNNPVYAPKRETITESFTICTLVTYCNDPIKEDDMYSTCSTHEGRVFVGKPDKRDNFKICDLYWRVWTGFESECRQEMGFCETWNIIKCG